MIIKTKLIRKPFQAITIWPVILVLPDHAENVGLIEHELVDIFVADAGKALTVVPNPQEVAAVRWVDLYDLSAEVLRAPEKFTPWLRIYLAEHMDRIFGSLVSGR
jgi:isopentenyl-diphosphate delta-isomerase